MRLSIETPPRTAMEVYKMLPEGTMAEVIDNQLYMSPAPSFDHQDIVIDLSAQLRQALKNRAKVSIAPFDVYLDETSNAVQPDILIIMDTNKGILKRNFQGVPDITVEILPPSNREYDLIRKKELYERFGVQEYWIIDPDTKAVLLFVLENGKYTLKSQETGVIHSPLLQESFSF
jgi:Uma2 family endonuclease